MKRSKVLLKIAKLLHKQALDMGAEVDENFEEFKESWVEDADKILSEVEKMGMFPPPRIADYSGIIQHTWEPEDADD